MVEVKKWGELQEQLEGHTNNYLKDLCYILGLKRSGSKQQLVDEIKHSEYAFQYVIDRHNFLFFGLYIIIDRFSSSELTNLTREFNLPRGSSKWDKMVEIINSEEITPRMLLGHLRTNDLENLFEMLFEEESNLGREGITRRLIEKYKLDWLDEIMDKGFILMPMLEDADLQKTYQIIKFQCKKFDINAIRIDEIHSSAKVDEKVLEHIDETKYLIVDLTNERPNVYYELGYAHGINKKFENIILIAKKGTQLHFDIRNMSTIFYKDHKHLRKELMQRLKIIKKRK